MKTATRTTAVPARASFLDGQVTFFNSVFTSLKNCLAPSNFSLKENVIRSTLSEACLKHPLKKIYIRLRIPQCSWLVRDIYWVHGSHEPYEVYGLSRTSYGAWQARRDSNPHHPDLESGALTVRATGLSLVCGMLKVECSLKNFYPQPTTLHLLLSLITLSLCEQYAFDRSDNTSLTPVYPELSVYSWWWSNSSVYTPYRPGLKYFSFTQLQTKSSNLNLPRKKAPAFMAGPL